LKELRDPSSFSFHGEKNSKKKARKAIEIKCMVYKSNNNVGGGPWWHFQKGMPPRMHSFEE